MEAGELKDHLIALIVNHMRKSLLNWNRDNATDDRVLKDIRLLSKGELEATVQHLRALEGREPHNRPRRKNFSRKGRD
ncbi:hypothetical protein JCM15548_13459 [Geofilum rubicundum JCM 15548]|uniref:Uncharacterized protein n=1 Tax=Geofilum rubicundum JCM 15548 TaxID=1236989 RepID=A0A0E9LZX6_9BACT|nr:hypothetical protein JCM15548_13459 [Geofilum rubicundum JCM 15548]